MTDSLFSNFAKAANYVTKVYSPYAAPINFLASPAILLGTTGSHLYQMTKTGVSLGSMAVALVDTIIRSYALPFATRTGAEIISNITGLNAELLNIPAQIGTQALYTKAKNYLMNDIRDNNGDSSLIRAVNNGQIEITHALIQAGAKINNNDKYSNHLINAAQKGDSSMVKVLIHAGVKLDIGEKWGNNTALTYAAGNGHTEIVKNLIQAGAGLDYTDHHNSTALMGAAENGHTEIVKALIQAGAILNYKNGTIGKTALIMAAENGHTDTVKALIQAKFIKLDSVDGLGNSALKIAAKNGHTNTVKALIKAGANPDVKDKFNMTALMCAVCDNDEKMVQCLIQGGAKPDSHTHLGSTPLTIANKRGHNKIAFLILRAMSLKKITSALEDYPELKNLVDEFRKKENKDAIKIAVLEANEYLVFPARMCLKWQAAKAVAKKYTPQDLVNQDIPKSIIKTVEASRTYIPF